MDSESHRSVCRLTKIVKGTETDKWLPIHWRKTTFPVLRKPVPDPKYIVGAAFLLQYQGIIFITSAKHVVDRDSLVLHIPKKDKGYQHIPLESLKEAGAVWISHPADLDLTAIPFPDTILEKLDVRIVAEDHWVTQGTIEIGSDVAHLGFPKQAHANYVDGTPALFPLGMPGRIIGLQPLSIQLKTDGAPGASGGPVFLKREKITPLLIGVATDIKMMGNPARPDKGKPLQETSALPISLIKDILESTEMVEQCEKLGFAPAE